MVGKIFAEARERTFFSPLTLIHVESLVTAPYSITPHSNPFLTWKLRTGNRGDDSHWLLLGTRIIIPPLFKYSRCSCLPYLSYNYHAHPSLLNPKPRLLPITFLLLIITILYPCDIQHQCPLRKAIYSLQQLTGRGASATTPFRVFARCGSH